MRMNTRLIMGTSAFLLFSIGLSLTFLATEIAGYILVGATPVLQLLIQVLGALYFAFAMLNWMAKGSSIGGIYNRPIAVANFAHFFIGALALLKALKNHPDLPWAIGAIAGVYAIFAILFGILLFRSPVSRQKASAAL